MNIEAILALVVSMAMLAVGIALMAILVMAWLSIHRWRLKVNGKAKWQNPADFAIGLSFHALPDFFAVGVHLVIFSIGFQITLNS